ncbi:flagellar assembly protein FliW [Paenibacillus tepidiphilus]|uniref:flagellar assembly protein FliW n=1 Tax=Paenibacillus tepidiphilus TaxID=2608683 RepID=UPI0012388EF3|nr:flagellar assembly protein FliW [Paenibacillus tepidiphilus]
MIIETASMGQVEVESERIYHFAKGIPGFEQETDFAVIDLEGGLFSYLQSLHTETLCFLLTDPFIFYPQYEFELPESDTEELQITEAVLVRTIVTLRETLEESTLNLLAPIVLNPDNQSAKQVVLHKSHYSTKQFLWVSDNAEGEETPC